MLIPKNVFSWLHIRKHTLDCRYMREILPIRRKYLFNQSIKQSINHTLGALINPSVFFLCRAVGEIHFVQCDLRDVKQVEELCRRADQIFPAGIDILVNNAGNIELTEVL